MTAGEATLRFTCRTCGSQIQYVPGTTTLRCTSCGTVQPITPEGTIDEHSYDAWAALPPKPVATIGAQVLQCQNCGAETETDDIAGVCQFCGGVLVATTQPEGLVVPEAVVPFHVDKTGANDAFRTWVRSRRFAPSALKKVGSTEAIRGTYIPHWTYDAHTATDYDGQRGDYYYVTRTRTVSDGKGGTRTETYQERHTRWRNADGHVERSFDDVLVPASHRLDEETLQKMGPWTLRDARAYQPDYLAGYSALRYDVDPDTGLGLAKSYMGGVVEGDVRADIGGDEQRIEVMNIQYAAVMFKLMLLPLWIASYVFGGKTFQVLVNANTGEVVGDRPYSAVKITLAVLAALVVVAAIVVAVVLARRS
jgi:Zn finger protein HypA/HybF involved in hydrogenase expression